MEGTEGEKKVREEGRTENKEGRQRGKKRVREGGRK